VTRHGESISEQRVPGAISTGIAYSLEFAGWEAAIAAGLDLLSWDQGRYPRPFMHKVVAWHNLHQLIAQHGEAAAAEAAKAKAKK
jgi:hypothetical protein